MSCLSSETALEFVAGALPKIPAQEVELHMAKCADCRVLVVEIAKVANDTDLDCEVSASVGHELPKSHQGSEDNSTEAGTQKAARGQRMGERSAGLQLQRGSRIERYTLLYRLGEGGMGAVHAAFDPKLDRRVALKFLRTDVAGIPNPAHRDRLVREARALARLSHVNVVSIFDVAESGGSVYLAMELIEGSNARIWRELGERSVNNISDVYRQSLGGLIAAHSQGIVHRDFKPDNVMVGEDGIARVTDFGLARAAMVDVDELTFSRGEKYQAWQSLTQTGLVLGTPRYMAPEQFRGEATELSDQFSYCLSFYEALYGHYPFGTKTPLDLDPTKNIANQVLDPLGKDTIPEGLRKVLLRGMAVDSAKRWPNLKELESELNAVFAVKKPKGLLFFLGAGALVAALAFYFSPAAPPAQEFAKVADNSAELEALRKRVDSFQVANLQLAKTEEINKELTKKLHERERELALIQLAEEEELAKENKRVTRIRALPVRSVERSVTTHLSEVLACYQDSVVGDDELQIKVNVGIEATGAVKWMTPTFQGSKKAGRCLEKAITSVTLPANDGETTATLHLSFFRLESGLLAVNMRAKTRKASLGQVTIDSKGHIWVDCSPDDPLCGL